MIFWSSDKTESPANKEIGQYLVCSEDGTGNLRADIEYWDGSKWAGMDERNKPLKWAKIDLQ